MNVESQEDQRQHRATQRMGKDNGVWDCRWEFLDPEGNIASTAEGTQAFKFVIADRVQQILINVPSMQMESVSHRFYKPDDRSIYWISVDINGDLWTFVESIDTNSAKSLPHKNADGTVTHLRFSSLRETENESDVLMESSNDDENWTAIFRQYRIRR